jgi:hypothetical protein
MFSLNTIERMQAFMTLTDDELRHAISAGMTHVLESITRVRHRRARIAALGAPLSIRASRAERRREARERPHRPARQQPLLTSYALRMQMIAAGDIRLTELDAMITDEQARALEGWARCEEILSGCAKSASWDVGRGGGGQPAPVPDAWLATLAHHATKRLGLGVRTLLVLQAFTALQNGSEGALSAAQCGERMFPRVRNKRRAFVEAVADVARKLV